jgi:LPS-assembly protein
LVLFLLAGMAGHAASAQTLRVGRASPVNKDEPVAFTADQVVYDRQAGLVTASGHVEAWQGDHVIHADRIVFDRNTNVVAATGNVVLIEPTETLFSDYAELTEGMRDGVLKEMRAILAENGRLAANGVRRTDGSINELSRIVYTTCNACAKDPSKPPLWQLRALSAVQDGEHKRIEYYDAVMEMYGVPIAYFPYFWHADPSVKRESGLLLPSVGINSKIGVFAALPYYWVIDDQSDITITPMQTSKSGPQLDLDYRYRFNEGILAINGSGAQVNGEAQGAIYARGRFSYDDTWRYGFDLNRATSANYIRDFHLGTVLGGAPNLLTSQAYIEGFGQGGYTRLDARGYQGLSNTIIQSTLPVVLPHYSYNYFGTPDALGGRLSIAAGAFNILRSAGTNTKRASLSADWERPFSGPIGDQWKFTLHGDAAGYDATGLNQQPNYSTLSSNSTVRGLPQAAMEMRWPLLRNSGAWGGQLIEPIVQMIVAPRAGNSQFKTIPNEDSLDLEFTDSNLFAFNRFPGIDRLEGGSRVNAAMHGAWYLGGTTLDGLVGQSYQTQPNTDLPAASGLRDTVSDIVARGTFAPTPWLDLTYRTRLNKNSGATRMADALASVGGNLLRVTGGYIYTTFDPYNFYNQASPPPVSTNFYVPRNEVTLGASSHYGNYSAGGYVRRDLATNKMVQIGANAAYEDECYILQMLFVRRYTSFNGDGGSNTVLFQMTFKTIGQFGFRAL